MRIILLALAVFLLAGCGNKKKATVSGEEPVTVEDFVASFPVVQLPYQLADADLTKRKKDSVVITYKVFSQFIPDSVLKKFWSKTAKPKIYPLARIQSKEGDTYLLIKVVTTKTEAWMVGLDKENNFIAMMPVLQPDANAATQQSFVLDRRFTLSKVTTRKNADGTLSEGKEVFVLNAGAKTFTLIMTEALDEKNIELINPIDSFPRQHKLSADYVKDKNNLVSIRDHKRTDRLYFFVHISKNNGDCTGELKGEAMLTSPNTAIYRPGGNPCSLQFHFTSSSVTITEQGCGSHRGIDCLFNGSFPKKKQIRSKKLPKLK
ncbi:MAG: hypothetical protein C4308_03690 [Chitinophagaceae bacterium]